MPPLLQIHGGNLRQLTLSKWDEVAAIPELGVGIGAFVCLAHQRLVRNKLMELVEYMGATSIIESIRLLKELLLKFR